MRNNEIKSLINDNNVEDFVSQLPKMNRRAVAKNLFSSPEFANNVVSYLYNLCNKALDVDNSSTKDGGNVLIWSDNGQLNQRWNIIEVGDGYIFFENVNSGKMLDVDHSSLEDGANVLQWSSNGNYNQQWKLISV